MDKITSENRRKYLRYRPDHMPESDLDRRCTEITGFVDPSLEGDFEPAMGGLLADKSHAGCSLAVISEHERETALSVGDECRIKAGPLSPMRATVRWRKKWDEGLVKIGFEFLE